MDHNTPFRLAGFWNLTGATFTTLDGTVHEPWGPSPKGISIITEGGDCSTHVMRSDRQPFSSEHPSPGEKERAFDEYFSYFGRFLKFDKDQGAIIIRIIGATHPNWTDKELTRYLDVIDEDHFVIRTPPVTFTSLEVVGRLSWTRRREETPIIR
jgi:hypothetical protein